MAIKAWHIDPVFLVVLRRHLEETVPSDIVQVVWGLCQSDNLARIRGDPTNDSGRSQSSAGCIADLVHVLVLGFQRGLWLLDAQVQRVHDQRGAGSRRESPLQVCVRALSL